MISTTWGDSKNTEPLCYQLWWAAVHFNTNPFFKNIAACKLFHIRRHSWSGFQTKLWFCRKQDVANCFACVGTRASLRRGLRPQRVNKRTFCFVQSCRCCPDAQRLEPAALMQLHILGVELRYAILRRAGTENKTNQMKLSLKFSNKRPRPCCLSVDSSATYNIHESKRKTSVFPIFFTHSTATQIHRLPGRFTHALFCSRGETGHFSCMRGGGGGHSNLDELAVDICVLSVLSLRSLRAEDKALSLTLSSVTHCSVGSRRKRKVWKVENGT